MPTLTDSHEPAALAAASRVSMTTWLVLYGALLACFLIANITNGTIIHGSGRAFSLLSQATDRNVDALIHYSSRDNADYFLSAAKSAVFLAAMTALAILYRRVAAPLWPDVSRPDRLARAVGALALASVFIFAIFPAAHGLIYSKLSLNPFSQEPTFWYRRILMVGLASLLQLKGALYIVLFWAVTVLTVVLAQTYAGRRNLTLTTLELASLVTTGMFGVALALPGYPEILVLCLTLVAMLDFEHRGRSGPVQVMCFGLALLTHESAAVLAFGALGLFLFGRTFLVAAGALLAAYVFTWLMNFGFDTRAAVDLQTAFGGATAMDTFRANVPRALFSLLSGYKLLVVILALALIRFLRGLDYRSAAMLISLVAGGLALTLIATDYTRMIGFGSFAMLLAIRQVAPDWSMRRRQVFAALNLLTPLVIVQGASGVWVQNGLYGLALRVFGIHR